MEVLSCDLGVKVFLHEGKKQSIYFEVYLDAGGIPSRSKVRVNY